MAIYRAYIGGKEIKEFIVGGKSVDELYGGNTLLWRKSKHPLYSQYFMVDDCISVFGDHPIDEYGIYLDLNEGAIITKCAVNVYKYDKYYFHLFACRGENITRAVQVPYFSYRGEIIYDGYNVHDEHNYLWTAPFTNEKNGVWSRYDYLGDYWHTAICLQEILNPFIIRSEGATENVRLFHDRDEFEAWMMF